jgi:anthranilate phosphoribosyltransferase
VKLELPPEALRRCLDEAGMCFCFARMHHPAMKYVAAARTALGIPTIFNLLGPLTNPARAQHQLLGVFAPELTDRLAEVLRRLGSERAWVVHAVDGLDELSTLGPTRISELKAGQVHTWTLDPLDLHIPSARLSDLQVASAEESADVIRRILDGERFPPRDIALLNAAAALVVAEMCEDLVTALERCRQVIDTGAAKRTLEKLVQCSNA